MHKEIILKSARKLFLPYAVCLALFVITIDSHAASPPNDNLTNAQVLLGLSGSVTGNNQGATAETAEPPSYYNLKSTPAVINPASASIWYSWTAPITEIVSFDTRNSTLSDGSTMDTVMSVYTLPGNGTLGPNENQNFANLTLVTNNDDDLNAGSWPLTSRVSFQVVVGNTYYFQLDGSKKDFGTNEEGYIVLNWGQSLAGGVLRFATNVFAFGQMDDEIVDSDGAGTIDPSLSNPAYYQGTGIYAAAEPVFGGAPIATNNQMADLNSFGDYPNGRITVTRTGAANGRIQVDMLLTNDFYENTYTTNIWITNIEYDVINYDTNTNSMTYNQPLSTNFGVTNIWYTNIDLGFEVEYDYNGTLEDETIKFYRLNIRTNIPNAVFPAVVDGYGGVTNCGVSNKIVEEHISILPPGYTTNLGANGTNIASLFVVTTNLSFNNPPPYTFLTPSAMAGVDYSTNDNQTLTFDDFQMSQDAYVAIGSGSSEVIIETNGVEEVVSASGVGTGGPDWPDALGNNIVGGINRRVILTLANPRLDPLESLDVSPPTLDTNYLAASGFLPVVNTSQADMNILDFYNPNPPSPCSPTNNTTYNFDRRTYRVDKDFNGTFTIFVYRNGGGNTVQYYVDDVDGGADTFENDFNPEAGSDYAYGVFQTTNDVRGANWDFSLPYAGTGPGTITFPTGATAVGIVITNNDNGAVEFNQDLQLTLVLPNGAPATSFIGDIGLANVTILYSDRPGGQQPGGAVDRTWNIDNQPTSVPPQNTIPGANLEVDAVSSQTNGTTIIAGQFDSYDGNSQYHNVVRLLANGFPDPAFNPGSGGNDSVLAVAVDAVGRIIVGGNFTSFNNQPGTYHIARLNANGSVDSSFNTGAGANGTVRAIALDASGNILIGGDFTTFNNITVSNVARVLPNGTLDTSFNPGAMDPFGTVNAVAVDSLNNIIIGGSFGTVNGTNWPGLARLLSTGALDTSFNPGNDVPGGTVYTIAVQEPGNQIIIGGAFSQYNLYNLNNIARANFNGSVDTNFNAGAGANDTVYSILVQPDGRILLGGQFTKVASVRRVGFARLFANGWVDTSFLDPSYNQFAGLINHYYNSAAVNPNDYPAANNTLNFVKAMGLEPSGNLIIGGSFNRVGGGFTRDDVRPRWNVARIIGNPTPGPQTQSTAQVAVVAPGSGNGNYPGNITFTQPQYSVDDKSSSLFVTVQRSNGSLGPINVTLGTNNLPPGAGAAGPADYGLLNFGTTLYAAGFFEDEIYGWRLADGAWGVNYDENPLNDYNVESPLELSIHNNLTAQQNLFAGLSLISVTSDSTFFLGGENIPTAPAMGLSSSQLEIINDNFPAGTLGFSATNYSTVDANGFITISVLRTNGSSGNVSVAYKTANGFTNPPLGAVSAIAGTGFDYIATNGTLNFANGTLSNGFKVQINGFSSVQPTKFFNVELSNPGGGASLDTNIPPAVPSISTVAIVDDNFSPGHLSFNSTTFSGTKGGVSTITVNRTGGGLGTLSVQVLSSDLTASNGLNYLSYSNTLTWGNSNLTPQTVIITNLEDNVVDGTKTMKLTLLNPVVLGNPGQDSQVLLYPTNATNFIADDDFYGVPTFVVNNFNVLQNGGSVLITVVRTGGTTGTVTVNYTTSNGTNATSPSQPALAGTNYGATSGSLTFLPGVTSQSFSVPIFYTPTETNAANRIINLTLSSPNPLAITNGFPKTATVTILDNQLVNGAPGTVDTTIQTGIGFNGVVQSLFMQPDGKVLAGGNFSFVNNIPFSDVARLNADGSVDTGFLFNFAGADAIVRAVLSQTPAAGQTNGPIVVVGDFTNMDNVGRRGIARLNLDGSLDETLNPGAGADSGVYAVIQMPTNQFPSPTYVIGGAFANYNGVTVGGIARLNNLGQIDSTFNPGGGVTGTNGTIHALAVQQNGQVLVGGDFTVFNNLPFHHLVRLNLDGSVDTTFNPDTGADISGSVQAILIQPDGKVVIGGVFTTVNGVNLNHIARLNQDGTLDTGFNVGLGANNTVLSLALDSQQRILVAGQFTIASGVTRNGITRLNPDGTVDPTINFGAGANGYINTIAIQTNDEINVGGLFTSFGGVAQNNFTRLFGGAVTGPGVLNFSQAVFGALESQSNAIITVQRSGGTGSASIPVVSVVVSTADGTGLAGLDYVSVTNTVTFPLGEVFESVTIPLLNTGAVGPDKTVNLNLSNPVAAALGVQSTAVLVITNINAAVSFSSATYRQAENVPGGNAIIPVVRVGSQLATLQVTAYTGTNGTAIPGVDYAPQTNLLIFPPGVATNLFVIPLLDSANMQNDATVDLELANPTNGFLVTPSEATLTIATVNAGPGVVAFSQTNYTVSESASSALITLIRTNGVTGNISVVLSTSNGTAVAGVNYSNVTQTVNFSSSSSSQTVSIPIISNSVASPNTTVNLVLSNPVGTTIGGSNVATLTIVNDIQNFTIGLPGSSPDYFVSEGGGVLTLAIYRNGPTNGTISVGYATSSPANASITNGFAVPGSNYIATSGTLTFVPGQTIQTIPISILQGTTVDGPLAFELVLTNASPGTQVGTPGIADITILGDVTGFTLATNAYIVGENGTNVVITVNRLNVDTGNVSVNFATSDGSAVGGIDYSPTNGVLAFTDGQSSNTVTIPILNPGIVEGTKTFNFALSNPVSASSTNCYLLAPSNAVVTITNVYTGISFSSSAYAVSETNFQAIINVIRTGVTTTNASISYATSPGTAVPGKNYQDTSGTLNFAAGVTNLSFAVTLIDDHMIDGDHTVNLTLSSPQGALLDQPDTAVLTVEEGDGSFVVPAGTLLLSESDLPTNGIIDPGETVTVDFGMRCISGGSTTNLLAVMQTNANVTPLTTSTNGPTNSYGVLLQGGHTVSRPFTFTATGTNSQIINVFFQLYDGSRPLTNVVYTFTLGSSVSTYANSAPITITNIGGAAAQPTAAIPYPSIINVSGLPGAIGKLTVTFSNLTHSLPSDIEAVLVTPSENASPSQNILLMADVGGGAGAGVTNLTQYFDDTAAAFMSVNQLLGNRSATNKPTGYVTVINNNVSTTTFIGNQWAYLPVMPAPVPAAPYSTNLSVLDGAGANGIWSLYVADTKLQDYGAINGGWALNISTGNPVPSDSDLELYVTAAPSLATVSNVLVYSVTLTNYGPAVASGVVISNVVPSGFTYLSNNFPGVTTTGSTLLFSATNSLAISNGLAFNIYVVPNTNGTVTNQFAAFANQADVTTNNITNIVSQVNSPSADLGVTLTGTPNEVLGGNFVTYTIVVTNGGPSTALAAVASNVLPAGLTFLSYSPPTASVTSSNGVSYWTIGNLGVNSNTALLILAQAAGTNTLTVTNLDSAGVASAVFDPLKFNNFQQVKTIIDPSPSISISNNLHGFTLTWSGSATNFVLQGATNLPPQGVWITLPNTITTNAAGQFTITLPANEGYRFFILKTKSP